MNHPKIICYFFNLFGISSENSFVFHLTVCDKQTFKGNGRFAKSEADFLGRTIFLVVQKE